MKRIALCSIAAMVIAACGGSDPEPTPTPEPTATHTATATPTNTPAPTATSTPDPLVVQVEEVAEDITFLKAEVAFAVLDLAPAANLYTGTRVLTPSASEAADILEGWESAIENCEDVELPALMPYIDLWPGPYDDLAGAYWSSCQLIAQRHAELGEPVADSLEWIAVAVSVVEALREAQDALPDHSAGQLRRAIADRQ